MVGRAPYNIFCCGRRERGRDLGTEKGESVTRFGGLEIVEDPGSSEGSARGQRTA